MIDLNKLSEKAKAALEAETEESLNRFFDDNHKTHNMQKVKLSNAELADKCEQWVDRLIKSGGKDWCLRVPVDLNNDPDMVFTELIDRFRELTAKQDAAEQKAHEGAIAFAEWIIKNNYNSTLDNKWVNYARSSEHYTTEQLYELSAQEGGKV